MISKIITANNNFEVYNDNNVLTSTNRILNKSLAAQSSMFYVLIDQLSNLLEVYDPKSQLIASIRMDNKLFIKCIDSHIYIKNGVFIEAYDENLNKLYISNANAAYQKLQSHAIAQLKLSLEQHTATLHSLKLDMVKNQQYDYCAELAIITSKLDELIILCTR